MSASTPIQTSLNNLSAWAIFDTLLQRLDITTDPDFWDGLVTLIPYQDYFLESQYTDLEEGCVPGEAQQGPNKTQTPNPPNQADPECLCANSPFYTWEIHGIECNEYRLLYWYHPDYGTSRATVARSKARLATVMRDLGHNEFITDMSGLPYQYFHYSAFGETLVEDNAHYGQFSSPYRFNAKELDGETGNYYYGARYYNPTWSVWLSVDPLAHEFSSWTPYHFVHNNPVNLIDPKGLNAWKPGDVDGEWVAQPGDGAESLARDAGISREEAYRIMNEQGYGTYTENGVTKSAVDPGDVVQVGGGSTSSTSTSSSCSPAFTPASTMRPQSVSETVSQSSGGQLNLVGAYGEASWYLSAVAGQDYGVMYSANVGFMTYRTDLLGLKTEAASFGGGGGLIFFTNSPALLTKSSFEGVVWNTELNFSVVLLDIGGSIGISPVITNGYRDFLIFVGGQGSGGASTPVASGGVTRGKTYVD